MLLRYRALSVLSIVGALKQLVRQLVFYTFTLKRIPVARLSPIP